MGTAERAEGLLSSSLISRKIGVVDPVSRRVENGLRRGGRLKFRLTVRGIVLKKSVGRCFKFRISLLALRKHVGVKDRMIPSEGLLLYWCTMGRLQKVENRDHAFHWP